MKQLDQTGQSPPGTAAVVTGRDAGRVAFAAFVGTALEWYDYFLFGTAAAIVFDRFFFTSLSSSAATLAAFATFGVGFAARPLGAVLFGWLGDRIGRRPALLITVVGIGLATGLIGVLPGYVTIGVAAPLLLVLLRLLQGFAVGGEWGGAVTLAVEHAPPEKRGRYAALPQVGSPIGTLMSSGAFALVLLLPSGSFDSWGWRLPFLLAFPLTVVAFYIRRKVEESPLFDELVRQDRRAKVPALEVFRQAWGPLLAAIASALLGVGGFYLLTTFVISYGTGTLGLSKSLMVDATLVAAGVEIVVILTMGRLAERIGPGPGHRVGRPHHGGVRVPAVLADRHRELRGRRRRHHGRHRTDRGDVRRLGRAADRDVPGTPALQRSGPGLQPGRRADRLPAVRRHGAAGLGRRRHVLAGGRTAAAHRAAHRPGRPAGRTHAGTGRRRHRTAGFLTLRAGRDPTKPGHSSSSASAAGQMPRAGMSSRSASGCRHSGGVKGSPQ